MADKPKPFKVSWMGDFGWLIWGLIGIGIIWFLTGGLYSQSARQGAYLKPPAPLDTGEVYGKYYGGSLDNDRSRLDLPRKPGEIIRRFTTGVGDFLEESKAAEEIHSTSLLSKSIYFDGNAGAKEDEADKEYIRIVSSERADASVLISGLTLEGRAYGTAILIPQATELAVLGESPTKTNVSLPPGGRALIATARSPIGTSFRVNMCTGYLDQFQNYTPDLRKECPSPEDELKDTELTGEKACVDFVKSLPRCRIYQGGFPSDLSSACKVFVTEKLNYNSCVASHKRDTSFYSNEWRIFLDRSREIWAQKNEIVKLFDPKGKIIDAITY
jgi:hypothetical protein